MKCFLLAAGVGSRLRPLTDTTPKCLLPINGKPLLHTWLERLQQCGIQDVLINTHWLREQVEGCVRQHGMDGLKVSLFHEPTLLGSAGTLLANKHWIEDDEPFLIIYSDNLTDVDLGRMVSYHRSHGLPFTLGVFHAENPEQCGIVAAGNDGLVTGFVEKPEHPKSNLAAAGVYVADRRLFDLFPPHDLAAYGPLDLGYHVLPGLVGQMVIFRIDGFFMDIGTVQSYEMAQKLWKELGS